MNTYISENINAKALKFCEYTPLYGIYLKFIIISESNLSYSHFYLFLD